MSDQGPNDVQPVLISFRVPEEWFEYACATAEALDAKSLSQVHRLFYEAGIRELEQESGTEGDTVADQ